MAKSRTYLDGLIQARAIKKQEMQAAKQAEQAKMEEKKMAARAPVKYETAVVKSKDVLYEVYNNDGKRIKDTDGKPMVRSGEQIMDKMDYDKSRERWISKKGKNKYLLKRKKR